MLSGKYNPVKSKVVDLFNILNVLPADIIDEEEKRL